LSNSESAIAEDFRKPFARPASVDAVPLRRAEILVLFAIALLQNLDRTVMGALLEPIKQAFALSDGATGALSGAAFGLAYATAGIVCARIADVANRKWVLALSVAAWSVFTLLCGYAIGFWTFFLARLGVGIFEAVGNPALHSLCADRFTQARRSSAASVLIVAMVLGAMIGITAGGLIAERYGWRAAFWVAGIPGLLLGPAVFRYLIEPRPQRPALGLGDIFGRPVLQAYSTLLAKPACRYILLGVITFSLWYLGTGTWFITYLVRSFHVSLSTASFGYGILSGVASFAGAVLNGLLGDRLAKRDIRWLGWLPAAAVLLCMVFAVPAYMAASGSVALLLYIVASACMGVVIPAQYAVIYALAGSRSRAIGVAMLLFAICFAGMALGPTAIGALSDALADTHGENSLKMSLLIVTGVLPFSAWFFARSVRFFASDIERD
jgi:MFS family permease